MNHKIIKSINTTLYEIHPSLLLNIIKHKFIKEDKIVKNMLDKKLKKKK